MYFLLTISMNDVEGIITCDQNNANCIFSVATITKRHKENSEVGEEKAFILDPQHLSKEMEMSIIIVLVYNLINVIIF